VKAGVIIKHDQRLEDGSYESWFGNVEAEIDWFKPVADVYNTIRAANPAPGAWTTVNGSELKVYDSACVAGSGAFGEVVSIDNRGVMVQGNGGRILIKRVRPAGGGKISASEWAAHAEINPGTKLGSKP
jgi:methionyl-tRNA formyltransferase